MLTGIHLCLYVLMQCPQTMNRYHGSRTAFAFGNLATRLEKFNSHIGSDGDAIGMPLLNSSGQDFYLGISFSQTNVNVRKVRWGVRCQSGGVSVFTTTKLYLSSARLSVAHWRTAVLVCAFSTSLSATEACGSSSLFIAILVFLS